MVTVLKSRNEYPVFGLVLSALPQNEKLVHLKYTIFPWDFISYLED
jgi:hypothetical protein